jgi:hypothetical protein
MGKDTSLNDIRTRIQLIYGKLSEIDAILMDKDCPQTRWGLVDFSTKGVLQQLERLTHILAQNKKESSNVT